MLTVPGVYRFLLTSIPLLFLLLTVKPVISTELQGFEIDTTCSVYRVVDGDTFDCFPVGRIRLADVNAPELSEPGGYEAKRALEHLIQRYGTEVYLDVDDVYVMDKYNRVVAVVYTRYNDTHLLNVNEWLVENSYVQIVDYSNEFDPYSWSLYVYYPTWMETTRTVTYTVTATKTTTSTTTVTSTITVTYTTTIPVTTITTYTAVSTVTSTVTTTLTKTTTLPPVTVTTTLTTVTPTTTTTLSAVKWSDVLVVVVLAVVVLAVIVYFVTVRK